MIALIAHTAPEAKQPSKNHEIIVLVPNKKFVGEIRKIPKKNPTHVEQHIIHPKIPEMNLPKPLNGAY